MPLYNFQKRFVPMIESGAKAHTIRAKRKRRPKVGETCYLYTGCRTKAVRKLGDSPCTRVQDIRIENTGICYEPKTATHFFSQTIWIDGEQLGQDEADLLAVADGFSCFNEMMSFWTGRFPFEGDLIHWRPL